MSKRRKPQHFRPQQFDAKAARKAEVKGGSLLDFDRTREIDAGDLSGAAAEPLKVTFGYFGARIRVNPHLSETIIVDLLEKGEEIEVEDPRQLLAIKDYVREHIHEDDWDTFWDLAREKGQGVHDLMRVCHRLMEALSKRPTTPPSGSSDGRRATPTNSPAGVSGRVIESDPEPQEEVSRMPQTTDPMVLGRYFAGQYEAEGRPDKAAQVMLAAEARQRALATV